MTLEIVPGSLTSPDPSIKNYAPYAPAIGVTGYTDRWRPALDFAVSAVGDAVTTYPSPLMPDNILVGDTTNQPVIVDQSGVRMVDCATRTLTENSVMSVCWRCGTRYMVERPTQFSPPVD